MNNPNTINLVVELGPESQAKLDKILEALQGIHPNCHSCTETALQVMGENLKVVTGETAGAAKQPEQPTKETDHPAGEVSPHGVPEPAEEPEAPKYTKADVLALVQKLAAPGSNKRDKAKAIVNAYGAKVSDIPEDKYAEAMAKLTKLAEEG